MTSYPTEGARVHAGAGRSKFDLVLDAADLGVDRSAVASYATFLLNTTPGLIPSYAAGDAVRAYRANPEAVLNRPTGRELNERVGWAS